MRRNAIVFLLLFPLSLLSVADTNVVEVEMNKKVSVPIEVEICPDPTIESVFAELVKNGIKFPDVVLSQALLESDSFKSTIFKENGNMFGMKMPKVRKTIAIGENRGHAVYDNWLDSVRDYKLWQSRIKSKCDTRSEYISYLDKVYSEDSSYDDKILGIIHSNKLSRFKI